MFWTNALIDILLFFYVIVCCLMGLTIMMQRSKQEGLGAAFGGGFTESVWGAQTSQVLVKATVWLAALFFIISIGLARLYAHRAAEMEKGSPVQQELLKPVSSSAPLTVPSTPAPTTSIPTTAAPTPTSAVQPVNATPVPTQPANPPAK